MSENYKGHIITIWPLQHADQSGWWAEATVFRQATSSDTIFAFKRKAGDGFLSREAASEAALEWAKQIIDRGYEESAVIEPDRLDGI